MNKFDSQAIASAAGPRDGDSIELRNQWAKVTINHDATSRAWIVTGDLADLRARQMAFGEAHAALSYALRSLAEYQYGRAD